MKASTTKPERSLYHCLDRETIQNLHTEIISSRSLLIDYYRKTLKEASIEIVDWISTDIHIFKGDHSLPATMWVITLYNPHGMPLYRGDFPEEAIDFGWFEPSPYHQIVTAIVES